MTLGRCGGSWFVVEVRWLAEWRDECGVRGVGLEIWYNILRAGAILGCDVRMRLFW
jgi:hypothetical protein